MKTTLFLWGALLLLSPNGLAQDTSIAGTSSGTTTAKPKSQGVFDLLHHEFVKARVNFSAKLKELRKSKAYIEARKTRDFKALKALMAKIPKPGPQILPRFLEEAEKVKGTPEEAKLLFFVLGNSGRNQALREKVFNSLKARHFDSKGWGPYLQSLPWILPKKKAKAFIAKLAKESPHPEIRIMARYLAAISVKRDRRASQNAKDAAAKTLEEIRTQYPDSLPGMSLNAKTFIKNHLQIGMKAPDIIGTDVYGKPMKLSDFLGRVVVIDFWGDW